MERTLDAALRDRARSVEARSSGAAHRPGLARLDLAVQLDFAGAAAAALRRAARQRRPFERAGASQAAWQRGASCNCEVITLIPHCNGTHTECVGHLTRERLDAWRVVPAAPPAGAAAVGAPQTPARRARAATRPPQRRRPADHARALSSAPGRQRAPFARARARHPHAAQRRRQAHARLHRHDTRRTCRARRRELAGRARHPAPGRGRALDRPRARRRAGSRRTASSSGCRRARRSSRTPRVPAPPITELAFIPEAVGDGWYLLPAAGAGDRRRRGAEPAAAVSARRQPAPHEPPRMNRSDDDPTLREQARARDAADPLRGLARSASRCRADAHGGAAHLPVRPLARAAPLAARELVNAELDDWARLGVLGSRAGAPAVDPLPREPDRGPCGAHRRAARAKSSP